MANFYGRYNGLFGSGGGGGGSSIPVEKNGVSVVSALAILNFTGAGVTVTDAGSGQADVAIPGYSPTQGNLTDVGTDGIVITGGTNAVFGAGTTIAQQVSDATHNGYLSSADWVTFNSKQAALTFGNLTDVGTDGIVITGGIGAVIGSGTSISQQVSDATHNGYLSSTDWSTFNAKQAAGNYITALTGEVTASGPGSVSATVSNAAVIAKVLTGYASGAGTVSATDTILQAIQKLNGNTAAISAAAVTSLTGDVTGTGPGATATTLATVNGNVGSFTYSSITVNAKGLITAASNGTAPVTSLTVASSNGFAGSFSASTTPVLTIQTSITGLLKGNGTAVSAASAGTDYLNVTATNLVEALPGMIEVPTAKTYILDQSAAYAYTINTLIVATASGTCTAAVKINGTNVTGISAVSVSSTPATGTASAANSVAIGDKVTLVLSSISSAADLSFTLKVTRA